MTSGMATPEEMITKIDTAMAAIVDGMASGSTIIEWNDGPLRVRNESPALLLADLRKLRNEYLALVSVADRRPAILVPRGRCY